MFKNKLDKLKRLYRGLRCYLGIHNYKLGVAWAPNKRLDECSNPECQRFSATYGHQHTGRWVDDKKGWEFILRKAEMELERRQVLIEKFKPEPKEEELSLEVRFLRPEDRYLKLLAEDAL